MTRKQKPSNLEDLTPNRDVEESKQDGVRGGFISSEHGSIGGPVMPPPRTRADRSPPTRG